MISTKGSCQTLGKTARAVSLIRWRGCGKETRLLSKPALEACRVIGVGLIWLPVGKFICVRVL